MSAVLLIAALVLAPVIGGGFGELAGAILEILVFAAIIARLTRSQRDAWARVPGLWALAAFFGLVCLSAFFTESIYAALRHVIYLAACTGAYVLAGSLFRDWRAAAAAVWGITLAALGISLIGIRDYAYSTGGGARFWQSLMCGEDHWRLFGTFINPGFFAGFLVVAIPVALGVYLVTRRTAFVLLAGVAVVIEPLALMLTGTKFGIVAAVVTLLVLFTLAIASGSLRRARFTRLIVIGLVLAPLLVVFSGPVTQRIREAESGGSQVHSTAFRVFTWRSTVNMIRDHPFVGLGPGTFEVAYPRYAIAGPTKYAHESYLQIGAEVGLPALLAFLIALCAVAWRSLDAIVRGSREGKAPAEPRAHEPLWRELVPFSGWRMVNCALFAALVGSCVRNLADSDWFVIGIALPFCVLAGVLVAQSGAAKGSVAPGKGLRFVLIAACAVMIVLTGSFGLGDYFAPGELAQDLSNEEMLGAYERASAVSPLNPRYRREMAKYLAASGVWGVAQWQAEEAIRLAPTDASNYQVRAAIAAARGDPEAAIGFFRQALKWNPNSTRTVYQMALAYQAAGNERGYERALGRLLKIENSDYEQIRGVPELVDLTYVYAHMHFADKFLRERRYTRAITEYQAATDRLERWRSNKQILEMCRMLGTLTKEDEHAALDTLRQACFGLARAYDLSGDRARAREAREKGERVPA